MLQPNDTANTADDAGTTDVSAGALSSAELQILLDAALANKDRPNGATDEQLKRLFAVAGRRRPAPEYMKLWDEGIAEYRHEIQEELERDLAEGKNR